ncbi:MAG TPA: COX15/CtaA family protein [Fibrobacteria bacterium]|nr:COX15/CtaA family protein [Fibrobacteria bacterium]
MTYRPAELPTPYRPWLHVYAIALSACTFLLLFAGGMVTSTNSGLSVPDWPTTFGQNMFLYPPSLMKGGIFYEHGHRLFASAVGVLTIGICLAFWLGDRRRHMRWTGILALVLVILQGILGGITVRYKLPMPVSTGHACMAELFFLLTVFMAFATSRPWLVARPEGFRLAAPGQLIALIFVIVAFLQILIGAMMRHSYAGLAIPTFPLAFGEAVPPFWSFGIALHFLHSRVGAIVLVLLGISLIGRVLVSAHGRPAKVLAALLGVLLAVQCFLGMLIIWTFKAPVPASVHVVGGAAVLATGFLLSLTIYRLGPVAGANRRSYGETAASRPLAGESVALT